MAKQSANRAKFKRIQQSAKNATARRVAKAKAKRRAKEAELTP